MGRIGIRVCRNKNGKCGKIPPCCHDNLKKRFFPLEKNVSNAKFSYQLSGSEKPEEEKRTMSANTDCIEATGKENSLFRLQDLFRTPADIGLWCISLNENGTVKFL